MNPYRTSENQNENTEEDQTNIEEYGFIDMNAFKIKDDGLPVK
ncbi:MAG TPA: hypothetical protein VMT35_00720 [Ignavibacteriaceae bacterium]|nr:hypothetical protein [Ignavibacteriaceae bacterium]